MSEAKISQLVKRRGTIKSKITSFSNYINVVKDDSVLPNSPLFNEIKLRLEKIDALYEDFDTLQTEIEELTEDPDLRYQEREAIENQYYVAIGTARALLEPSPAAAALALNGSERKTRWHTSHGKLREGSLVLIKDKSAPPLMWSLGRILRTLPGRDGIARVADIKTKKGVLRRAYNTICPLPTTLIEDETSRRAV
ncbi:uncharacterized protein LOC135078217 [Ostrinia nubilalis]|uniref:uncharacterized protein LOC135078217 n=1 Tax=Ostrinia nubilalis TaxID=29057 RepID=UPI003082248C